MTTTATAEAPRLGGLKILVTSVLGQGSGGGTVMRVMDKPTGRSFALRVISREGEADDLAIDRARAECEASAKLGHPAILKVYDFRTRRSWFKVARAEQLMELVDGRSLEALKGLPIPAAVLAFQQVAAAVAHMHRRGVIHGDLRPAKVLLSKAGAVKVRGYGLSLLDEAIKVQLKFNGAYAAPELARDKTVTEQSDLYGLGATLYHVLTGRPPGSGNLGRVDGRKLPTPAAINPKVPGPLNELVVACLQSDPNRRPPDVYEVVKRLETMVQAMHIEPTALQGLAAGEDA